MIWSIQSVDSVDIPTPVHRERQLAALANLLHRRRVTLLCKRNPMELDTLVKFAPISLAQFVANILLPLDEEQRYQPITVETGSKLKTMIE